MNTELITTKYNTGNKKEEYYVNEKGVKHGKCIVYFANGKVCYETNFVNGVEHGTLTQYNNFGNVAFTFEYVNGKVV